MASVRKLHYYLSFIVDENCPILRKALDSSKDEQERKDSFKNKSFNLKYLGLNQSLLKSKKNKFMKSLRTNSHKRSDKKSLSPGYKLKNVYNDLPDVVSSRFSHFYIFNL